MKFLEICIGQFLRSGTNFIRSSSVQIFAVAEVGWLLRIRTNKNGRRFSCFGWILVLQNLQVSCLLVFIIVSQYGFG